MSCIAMLGIIGMLTYCIQLFMEGLAMSVKQLPVLHIRSAATLIVSALAMAYQLA